MNVRRLFPFIFTAMMSPAFHASGAALPDQPLGIKGMLDPSGLALTLLWEPVTRSSLGTPFTSLAGYNIYRRTTPRGDAVKINTSLASITVYADRTEGEIYYYSVRAVGIDGNESADSLLVDSSPGANVIFLSVDGQTEMIIPGIQADILRPSYNKYGVALRITLKEQPNTSDSAVVRNVRFQLLRGDTGEEVNDVTFSAPDIEIHLGYNGAAGQVAPDAPIGALSLYWFNGVAWVKLGGVHDRAAQTIDVKSSQLGNYQLRLAAPSDSLALNKANVFPSLFTPNGDGFNDRVYMVLENPNNVSVRGEIFDLAGRFVSALPAPTQTGGVGTTLAWAGRDSNGSVVPSGLYIYRIEGDGKTITGTVSVAR